MNFKLIITSLSLVCLFSSVGFASGTQFRNVREMAMGRATTAIVNNEASLYVNPAGLARAKHWLKLPRIIVGANQELVDARSELTDLTDDTKSESSRIDSIKQITPLKSELMFGFNPLLSYTNPGFGVGIFAQGAANIDIVNRVSPRVEVDAISDISPMVGGARDFIIYGKDVTLGISARYIHRIKYNGAVEIGDLIQTLDNNEGIPSLNSAALSGVNVDLGLLTDVDTRFGTFGLGFTLKNLGPKLKGKTKYGDGPETSIEEAVPIESVIGLSKELNLFDGSRMRHLVGRTLLTADYRIISEDSEPLRNLHFGVEQKVLFNRVALRGGINQGYIVGGFGVDLFVFFLDYALYVRENGSQVSFNDERLHVLQFGFLL